MRVFSPLVRPLSGSLSRGLWFRAKLRRFPLAPSKFSSLLGEFFGFGAFVEAADAAAVAAFAPARLLPVVLRSCPRGALLIGCARVGWALLIARYSASSACQSRMLRMCS